MCFATNSRNTKKLYKVPKEKVEISLELVKIDETLATNKAEKQLPETQSTQSNFFY